MPKGNLRKILYISLFILVLISAEAVNYMSQVNSPSSIFLNQFFIKRSVKYAKEGNFGLSIKNLSSASNINVLGQFGPYRNLLPERFYNTIEFEEDGNFRNSLLNYLSRIGDREMSNDSDQGLGLIYYKLALISADFGYKQTAIELFKKAMYNNPDFASFHGELINYYYSIGNPDQFKKYLEYCMKFSASAPLCESYKSDIEKFATPQPVGFLKDEVGKHYLNEVNSPPLNEQ